jgi:hypothetical protein
MLVPALRHTIAGKVASSSRKHLTSVSTFRYSQKESNKIEEVRTQSKEVL